jgi:hypothetical protein
MRRLLSWWPVWSRRLLCSSSINPLPRVPSIALLHGFRPEDDSYAGRVSRLAVGHASAPGGAFRPRQATFGRRNVQSIAGRRRRGLGQTSGLLLARCKGVSPHVGMLLASFRRGLGQRGATFLPSSGGFPGFTMLALASPDDRRIVGLWK